MTSRPLTCCSNTLCWFQSLLQMLKLLQGFHSVTRASEIKSGSQSVCQFIPTPFGNLSEDILRTFLEGRDTFQNIIAAEESSSLWSWLCEWRHVEPRVRHKWLKSIFHQKYYCMLLHQDSPSLDLRGQNQGKTDHKGVHILLAIKCTYTAENLRGGILFKVSDDDPNITFLQKTEASLSYFMYFHVNLQCSI